MSKHVYSRQQVGLAAVTSEALLAALLLSAECCLCYCCCE